MLQFLKLIITVLIPFVIYELIIEFLFSYLNQSVNDHPLTFFNFVGPFFLTIIIILLTGQRLIFKRDLIERFTASGFVKFLCVVLILLIIGWQIWYLVRLYKIQQEADFLELIPMLFGLCCSLFLISNALENKNS